MKFGIWDGVTGNSQSHFVLELGQTSGQPHANLMLTSCRPHANLVPTLCRPHANLMQTSCQPQADLVPTPCQPHANLEWSTRGWWGSTRGVAVQGVLGVQGVVGSRDGWGSVGSRVKGWWGSR